MISTENYIIKDLKPLSLKDSVEKAMSLFNQSEFSHLAVVSKNVYEGTLVYEQLEQNPNTAFKIDKVRSLLHPIYATDKMNWFEILQIFATHNCNALPVVDQEKTYLGYFELNDFLNIFKSTPFLHENGYILTIAKDMKDYSFSEITQIVETNNATLFGAFVSGIEDGQSEIVLKLSYHDINNTIQTFRRYGYRILNEFKEDKYIDYLNERSAYLEKYLNI
jgi:predicted transcriptional regulator